MKVEIDTEEWYPVHTVSRAPEDAMESPHTIDVDDSTVQRWLAVFDAFSQVQSEMSEVWDAVFKTCRHKIVKYNLTTHQWDCNECDAKDVVE